MDCGLPLLLRVIIIIIIIIVVVVVVIPANTPRCPHMAGAWWHWMQRRGNVHGHNVVLIILDHSTIYNYLCYNILDC